MEGSSSLGLGLDQCYGYPRVIRLDMTEKLFTRALSFKQTNKTLR